MRSELLSVPRPNYKSYYTIPSAVSVGARAPSEKPYPALDALRTLLLCKKTYVAELVFSEVARLPALPITGEGLSCELSCYGTPSFYRRPARRQPSGVAPWARLKVLAK